MDAGKKRVEIKMRHSVFAYISNLDSVNDRVVKMKCIEAAQEHIDVEECPTAEMSALDEEVLRLRAALSRSVETANREHETTRRERNRWQYEMDKVIRERDEYKLESKTRRSLLDDVTNEKNALRRRESELETQVKCHKVVADKAMQDWHDVSAELDKALDTVDTLRARVAELEMDNARAMSVVMNNEGLLEKALARVAELEAHGYCEECNAPLSYCGDAGADGPRLDCLTCKLRARMAELEAELEARKMAMEIMGALYKTEARDNRMLSE